MLVSVIIPTYNRGHLLKDAIDSVLSQTYQNFELLIIDDYSEDKTEEVVRGFKDSRVKYILNKRSKGAQGARNTGLHMAAGEWIALLDSDDVWLPNKLEKQINYIKNASKGVVGLSAGNAVYDFEKKEILRFNIPQKKSYTIEELLYKNYLYGFSTFFFNKNIALNFGGFDERFPAMQDIDFYVSMLKQGEIHSSDEVLVYMRTNNNDRITKNYKKRLIASKIFYKKYNAIIKRSYHLENRAISRMLVYGWKQNKISNLRYLHWVILGLFIDPSNLKWVIGHIIKQ